MRLLSEIDVNAIESAHIDLIRKYIRNKKFVRHLIDKSYPIAIDGTRKFTRNRLWAEECLERTIPGGKKHKKKNTEKIKKQYYVSVLEASLVFRDGMTIPLISEFLDYASGDTQKSKQDCKTIAFYRLTARLKKEFPALPVMLLLDGLYPQGPLMEYCREKKWQFMILLQDGSLKSMGEEFEGLRKLETHNTLERKWGNRRQRLEWVHDIEYYYGMGEKKELILHMAICEESWNAMRWYHYLMHLAHLFKVLDCYSY